MNKTRITAILMFILLFYISNIQIIAQNTNSDIIKEFIKEIQAFDNEKIFSQEPIQNINTIATKKAVKTISITKDNIKDALETSKQYKHNILIVGSHTIVKITDLKNCSVSGSWGTCMPYGEGFIKKGNLLGHKDYINNIIGKPDTQVRTLFLFN